MCAPQADCRHARKFDGQLRSDTEVPHSTPSLHLAPLLLAPIPSLRPRPPHFVNSFTKSPRDGCHTAAARAALTCSREFIHNVAPGLGALTSNLSCPKKRHLTCFHHGANRARGKYTGQLRNNALARARPRFQRTSSAEVSVFARVRCHGSHAHKNRLVY